MKAYTSQISLVVILATLFGVVFTGVAGPELSLENNGKINLGATIEGQLKRGSFTLTNSGDSRLSVEHYMVTCACLEITGSVEDDLSPGETGDFEFVFDTSGLGGKKSEKQVIIYSNDPDSPHRVKISTRVRAKSSYHVDPRGVLDEFSLLVDVRTSEKFSSGHILGAQNVPSKDLEDWATSLPDEVTVFLYSQDGEVSDKLAKDLDPRVQANLRSLVGGYEQWKLEHTSYLVKERE